MAAVQHRDMPIPIGTNGQNLLNVGGMHSGWKHVLWGGVESSSNNTSFTTSQHGSNASGTGDSEGESKENKENVDSKEASRSRLFAELNRRNIDTGEVSLRETNSSESSLGPSASEKEEELPPMISWKAANATNAAAAAGKASGGGEATMPGPVSAVIGPRISPAPMMVPPPPAAPPQAIARPIALEEALKDIGDLIDDSDDEYDEGDAGATVEMKKKQEQEHQAIISSLRAAPGSIDEMLKKVPLDSNGNPTSIGSIGHYDGQCKVCLFVYAKPGCMSGVECSFCHFPHKRMKRKNKMRPCKGKRDRYRKLVVRLTQSIEEDPDNFDLDRVELPPSVEKSETVKEKLRKKMHIYAERIRAERRGGVPEEPQQQWASFESPASPQWHQIEMAAKNQGRPIGLAMPSMLRGAPQQPASSSRAPMHGMTLVPGQMQYPGGQMQYPMRNQGKGAGPPFAPVQMPGPVEESFTTI
mmetsp:Transcript_107558/g.195647  ORF Transcript_107558/g.195647 Transcript_107558/m.195647 type:complete len:471 (+) Transcript_107558:70-1482(+)